MKHLIFTCTLSFFSLFSMNAQDIMMMKKDMSFPNGAMVMMDGTMKMQDGTSHMLKEGEGVMMDGTMKTMPMNQMMKDSM